MGSAKNARSTPTARDQGIASRASARGLMSALSAQTVQDPGPAILASAQSVASIPTVWDPGGVNLESVFEIFAN